MKSIVATGLASLFVTGPAFTSTMPSEGSLKAPLTRDVDAIFSDLGDNTPGCAVAASRDGLVLFRRTYGLADLELKTPIAPGAVFEAGSVSKQFTAATVLLLARQGRIKLSDDIRRYLPEMPDYGSVITIGDLLHHTSGIRDWGSLATLQGWPRNSRSATNADVLSIVSRQHTLNFAPGEHFRYSNSNYNLLVILVERVTGRSIEDVSRSEIFAPLGMTSTSWRTNHRALVPGRVAAYGRNAGGYFNDAVVEDALGNGGLLTTVDDLKRWQDALHHDAFGPGFTEQMQTKGQLRDGRAIGYGLGLYISQYRGWREYYHEGITGGYHAWVARYPEQKIAVMMLCNSSDIPARPLGRRVADLLLPFPVPPQAAPTRPVRAGTYVDLLTGIPLRIEFDANGALRVDGRIAAPAGPNRWEIPDDIFDFSEGALVRETIQGERFAYRLATAPKRRPGAAYAGRYCSPEADACLVIRSEEAGLTLSGPRGTARPLTPAYDDVFTGSVYPSDAKLTVAFERSRSGAVTQLRTSDGGASGVAFTRAP